MESDGTSKRAVRLWWLVVVVTTFALLSACVDEHELPGPPGASGGAPAAGAAPGVGAGSVGGSGGTAPTGSGGVVAAGGQWTRADWEAAIAPIPGPHEIWTVPSCDVLVDGSNSVQVGPEYSVVPVVGYQGRGDGPDGSSHIFDAFVMDYCLTADDCTAYPGGACRGSTGDAYCRYPEPPPVERCASDADCTSAPDGSCVAQIFSEHDVICYPPGECVEPSGLCTYAGDAPCTGDADCSEAAGGKCVFPIVSTGCWYDTCFEPDDCGLGSRCRCGNCVIADCETDGDCGEGQACALSPGFCREGSSYHCTTPGDECEPGEADCHYEVQPGGIGIWVLGHCLI